MADGRRSLLGRGAKYVLNLPLVGRAPGLRKVAALLARDPQLQTCEDCRHFNLQKGQEVMRQHKAFADYIQVVSPDEMHHVATEGRRPVVGAPTPAEIKARLGDREHAWADYGACLERAEIVHACWRCDKWTL